MDIIINDSKMDILLENEKTLKDVLVGIENEVNTQNGTIISIKVDKETISAEDLDNYFSMLITDISTLELIVINVSDVKYAFLDISKKIELLQDKFQNISILLQTSKDKEVALIVKDFADLIDYFCSVITKSALFPDVFINLKIDNKELPEFMDDFKQILSEFEQAFTQKDSVLIGDLSEYEILPRIEKIKEFCINLQK